MKPEHPDTVVVKNKYYPSGLRELDVWNYYQKIASTILRLVRNREVMIFFAVDTNKFVVKRKLSDGQPIHLTNKNYDQIIGGRTVSIHSAMRKFETFGVVDVDCDIFDRAKQATYDTTIFFSKLVGAKNVKVYFTGKESFHIHIDFRRNMNVDKIRALLLDVMVRSKLIEKYTILHTRKPHIPNLDLCVNKYRGNFIVPSSLSIWGLKCLEVPVDKIASFRKESARIPI